MPRSFVFFLVFLLSSSAAVAAPAYGTKMPKKGEFFGGVQHYAVFERELNKDHGRLESQQGHILLSYGIADWLSLDLKASMGTITHTAVDGAKTKYDTPVWGGGYGFRVRLMEKGKLKSVAGFQHISIHPESIRLSGDKHNAILDDWQGSALVSYDIRKFTPYTGLRYGSADYIHTVNDLRDRQYVSEERRFDAVLGLDIPVGEKAWINVEGAVGGGKALATSLNFKF